MNRGILTVVMMVVALLSVSKAQAQGYFLRDQSTGLMWGHNEIVSLTQGQHVSVDLGFTNVFGAWIDSGAGDLSCVAGLTDVSFSPFENMELGEIDPYSFITPNGAVGGVPVSMLWLGEISFTVDSSFLGLTTLTLVSDASNPLHGIYASNGDRFVPPTMELEINVVPAPSSLALLGLGGGVIFRRRRG